MRVSLCVCAYGCLHEGRGGGGGASVCACVVFVCMKR